jgi:hypothetical protein
MGGGVLTPQDSTKINFSNFYTVRPPIIQEIGHFEVPEMNKL